jgi:hypothetical protein
LERPRSTTQGEGGYDHVECSGTVGMRRFTPRGRPADLSD